MVEQLVSAVELDSDYILQVCVLLPEIEKLEKTGEE